MRRTFRRRSRVRRGLRHRQSADAGDRRATGTKLAVAAVSIPHAIGTSIRLWRFRREVDWAIVRSFGLTSAAGGLTGALLNTWATSRALELVFGSLLVLAGASQVTGYAKRWRLRGALAWLGGALSGFFGGLVGNQGGIRTAAMLGFDVDKRQFVATTTAVALLIDMARVPVYLAVEAAQLARIWPTIALATIGVVVGTLFGEKLSRACPNSDSGWSSACCCCCSACRFLSDG